MLTINGKKDGFIGLNKVYIGRANSYFNLEESPLHNPYPISNRLTREQSLNKYKELLTRSIADMRKGNAPDDIMIELLKIARTEERLKREGKEVILTCYCKPLNCHGDIVIAGVKWCMQHEWFTKHLYL